MAIFALVPALLGGFVFVFVFLACPLSGIQGWTTDMPPRAVGSRVRGSVPLRISYVAGQLAEASAQSDAARFWFLRWSFDLVAVSVVPGGVRRYFRAVVPRRTGWRSSVLYCWCWVACSRSGTMPPMAALVCCLAALHGSFPRSSRRVAYPAATGVRRCVVTRSAPLGDHHDLDPIPSALPSLRDMARSCGC